MAQRPERPDPRPRYRRSCGLAERLGISADTTVVAYDDYNGTFATRLWWVLTYYGHPAVKVLNGGWQRWLEKGRPATFRETVPPPGQFTPQPNEAMRLRVDDLRARHADPDLQVVNVLWPEMYAGTANPFGNQRAGHIPGSVNVPIERFLDEGDVPTIKPRQSYARCWGKPGCNQIGKQSFIARRACAPQWASS